MSDQWFGPPDGDCSVCGQCGCSGDVPTAFKVVAAGWTDSGNCDRCNEEGNAKTYSQSGGDQCIYGFDSLTCSPCGPFYGECQRSLTISDDGSNTVIEIEIKYESSDYTQWHWIKYKKTFSGRVDCSSLTDEPIPYDSSYTLSGKDDCTYQDAYGDVADALITAL